MTENGTVWNSNSQGIKEKISIQTCRRGGNRQPDGQDSRPGGGRRTWVARLQLADPAMWGIADWPVPHSHADKLGGTAGERDRPCK